MPIPPEIRNVPRPVNTIVVAYGKNKDRYGVRKRIGCKYVDGKRRPVNGPTIGHIIDGKFIPLPEKKPVKTAAASAEMKDWANVVLCDRLFKGVMQELSAVYSREDAEKTYCIAVLRVCNQGIRDYELQDAYEDSFLSELYPGIDLSEDTVRAFFKKLGGNTTSIAKFMQNRASSAGDHHLLIGCVQKSADSGRGTLLGLALHAGMQERRAVSVLYAYDLDEMEPVCFMHCMEGMPEASFFSKFVEENSLANGFIVAGRSIPEDCAQEGLAYPNLHIMNPVRRGSKLIEQCHMLDFTAFLKEYDGILFRKEKCAKRHTWLYSYRDAQEARWDEKEWLKLAGENNSYSYAEYSAKRKEFGTSVWECKLDLPPEIPYTACKKLAEIELVIGCYKSACVADDICMHDDCWVTGSEFCDFLSSVLAARLLNAFDEAKLLARYTFGEVMSELEEVRKVRIDGGEWQFPRIRKAQLKVLDALGLSPE